VPCRFFRFVLAACLLAFVGLHAVSAAQDIPVGPHVRSDDPKLRGLIARGTAESPTFREIVHHINRLPGFVYVVASRCGARPALSACLDHNVQLRGGYRFLRVNLLPAEPENRQLPLLAHELQHALEVLSDESAISPEGVAKLYERIGERRPGAGNFETEAARRVQDAVYRELREYRRRRSTEAPSPAPPVHENSVCIVSIDVTDQDG